MTTFGSVLQRNPRSIERGMTRMNSPGQISHQRPHSAPPTMRHRLEGNQVASVSPSGMHAGAIPAAIDTDRIADVTQRDAMAAGRYVPGGTGTGRWWLNDGDSAQALQPPALNRRPTSGQTPRSLALTVTPTDPAALEGVAPPVGGSTLRQLLQRLAQLRVMRDDTEAALVRHRQVMLDCDEIVAAAYALNLPGFNWSQAVQQATRSAAAPTAPVPYGRVWRRIPNVLDDGGVGTHYILQRDVCLLQQRPFSRNSALYALYHAASYMGDHPLNDRVGFDAICGDDEFLEDFCGEDGEAVMALARRLGVDAQRFAVVEDIAVLPTLLQLEQGLEALDVLTVANLRGFIREDNQNPLFLVANTGFHWVALRASWQARNDVTRVLEFRLAESSPVYLFKAVEAADALAAVIGQISVLVPTPSPGPRDGRGVAGQAPAAAMAQRFADYGPVNDYGVPVKFFDLFTLGILQAPVRMLVYNPAEKTVSVAAVDHSLEQLYLDARSVISVAGTMAGRPLLEPGTRNVIIGAQPDNLLQEQIARWVAEMVDREKDFFQQFVAFHRIGDPAHLQELVHEWIITPQPDVTHLADITQQAVQKTVALYFIPSLCDQINARGAFSFAQQAAFQLREGVAATNLARCQEALDGAVARLQQAIADWEKSNGSLGLVQDNMQAVMTCRDNFLREIVIQAEAVRHRYPALAATWQSY